MESRSANPKEEYISKYDLKKLEKNKLQFISGPYSWRFATVYFDNSDYKNFNLFGDLHYSKDDNCQSVGMACSTIAQPYRSRRCYEIQYALDQIFVNAEKTNQTVDFFLETRYITKETGKREYKKIYDDYITDILLQFSDCFQYDKSNCKYKTTRFHYPDLRSDVVGANFLNDFILIPLFDFIKFLHQMTKEDFETEEMLFNNLDHAVNALLVSKKHVDIFYAFFQENFQENISTISSYLNQLGMNITDKYISDYLKHFSKFYPKKQTETKSSIIYVQLKELEKDNLLVDGENISALIQNFLMEKYIKVSLEITDVFLNVWKWATKLQKNRSFEKLKIYLDREWGYIQSFFITLEGSIFDAYTLPRIFRNYGNKPSHSVIVYAGDEHINTYVDFIQTKLNIYDVIQVYGNPKRCLYNNNFETYLDPGYINEKAKQSKELDTLLDDYFSTLE